MDVVRQLKCMQGISEEFLPTFRFFQFKKSTSFASVVESEAHSASQRSSDGKVLLTMNDISQKILYDSSRSESDIISLVNQQASQEMMNPVNNMIISNNLQTKVLYKALKSVAMTPDIRELIQHAKSLTDDQYNQCAKLRLNLSNLNSFTMINKKQNIQKKEMNFSLRRVVDEVLC